MVRDIAEGLFDGCPVVRVNQGKKILDGSSEILRSDADEPAEFIGHGKAIRSRFPIPIADARDPLRQLEPCFALAQRLQDVLGTEHITGMVEKNHRVDRFGDEGGGSMFVGNRNGICIAVLRHDQDRHTISARELSDPRARFQTLHVRHDDIQKDEIRNVLFKRGDSRGPDVRPEDGHARHLQGFTDHGSHGRIVVDDEDHRTGRLHLFHCGRRRYRLLKGVLRRIEELEVMFSPSIVGMVAVQAP